MTPEKSLATGELSQNSSTLRFEEPNMLEKFGDDNFQFLVLKSQLFSCSFKKKSDHLIEKVKF